MAAYRDQAIADIRAQVGRERVICGLSGGVDSSVAAVLIHEAIGDQLTCVFVDTGLMRAGEAEEVVTLFRDHYNIPLIHADESDRFLGALAGVTDPEAKRKTIGRALHRGLRGARARGRRRRLPRPGHPLPRRDRERQRHRRPLGHHQEPPQRRRPARAHAPQARRAAARALQGRGARARPRARPARPPSSAATPSPAPASPSAAPARSPREKLAILRRADAVYLDQIRKHGLYDAIWQAFAVLLPVRSVGVMGDGRTYDYVCALRAVTSVDGMTADYYPFDHAFLAETATRIINEVKGINRVTYDITSKPPGTIEWESIKDGAPRPVPHERPALRSRARARPPRTAGRQRAHAVARARPTFSSARSSRRRMVDAAWKTVRAHKVSLDVKEALARASESTHADAALAVYGERVEQLARVGGDPAYAEAVALRRPHGRPARQRRAGGLCRRPQAALQAQAQPHAAARIGPCGAHGSRSKTATCWTGSAASAPPPTW